MLSVCLNPAWQKTLVFDEFAHGTVNRARQLLQCGGGKGVNLARAVRTLGESPEVALFAGGGAGDLLLAELAGQGIGAVAVRTEAETRTCTTVLDRKTGQITELIEPSGEVHPDEVAEMEERLSRVVCRSDCVAICGTLPPGITPRIYAKVVRTARKAGLPILLDGYLDVRAALHEGPTILKVNAAELRHLAGRANLEDAALECLAQFPLDLLAVTDGPQPALLFSRHDSWQLRQPELPVRNAIGAGDCASGALLLATVRGMRPPDAFRYALAVANASCLTDTPGTFDPGVADALVSRILVDRL